MRQLISGYHQQSLIPVLNRSAHGQILRDFVPGYDAEGPRAIEQFAEANGFILLQADYGFRFEFYPECGPDGCDGWNKVDVPVEEH